MTQRERQHVPRKRLVSFRLDAADIKRMRRIADRLQARESDVFRFALSLAFSRLALLCEGNMRGADLLPLLLDYGPELIRHFNIDLSRLAEIINAGATGKQAIEPADIELLAMRAVPENYLHARLHALAGNGGDQNTSAQLRDYFFRKYLSNSKMSSDNTAAAD